MAAVCRSGPREDPAAKPDGRASEVTQPRPKRAMHGIWTKRKEDIVAWLARVLYNLEYFDYGLLTYAGVVTLLEKHE